MTLIEILIALWAIAVVILFLAVAARAGERDSQVARWRQVDAWGDES